jgi:fluoride ion exporter CrcB/FEX
VSGPVAVQVLLLTVGAGLGSVLRLLVVHRAGTSSRPLVRRLGTAWANVPASFVAGAVLTWLAVGAGSEPLVDAGWSLPWLAAAFVLGTCGGLSTYSSLALEAAGALRAGDTGLLRAQAGGVALGVVAGVAGVGAGVGLAGLSALG